MAVEKPRIAQIDAIRACLEVSDVLLLEASMRRASATLTREVNHVLQPLKLTARQVELLRQLPQGRRVPFRDVVDMLQDHRTAVFRTVIELEVRELLVVRRSSTDRRAKLIRRSRKGDRLLAAATASVAAATRDPPGVRPRSPSS